MRQHASVAMALALALALSPVLVRDNDGWRIAAQAWDTETEARKIPGDLAARETA